MTLTPETLYRHELIGLHTRVVESTNPDAVGSSGRVVDETMRTLSVSDGSRVRCLPKQGTTFEFEIPCTDEAADAEKASGTAPKLPLETAGHTAGQSNGCEDAAYVTVDGTRLLSRPALRTEKTGVSTWR